MLWAAVLRVSMLLWAAMVQKSDRWRTFCCMFDLSLFAVDEITKDLLRHRKDFAHFDDETL